MPAELTWLGHASWQLKTGQHTILVDPFLDDSPTAPVKAKDVAADFILVSHGHFDHIADAAKIANRTGATVVSNYEITTWLAKQHGVKNTVGGNLGGGANLPFGRVKLTLAFHSSSLPDGSQRRQPVRILADADERREDLFRLRHGPVRRHDTDRRRRARSGRAADRRSVHDGAGRRAGGGQAAEAEEGRAVALQHLAADRAGREEVGRAGAGGDDERGDRVDAGGDGEIVMERSMQMERSARVRSTKCETVSMVLRHCCVAAWHFLGEALEAQTLLRWKLKAGESFGVVIRQETDSQVAFGGEIGDDEDRRGDCDWVGR